MIAAALLLALLGVSSPSDIRTRADAGPLLARASLAQALVARSEASVRICGLVNREREIDRLDRDFERLHRLVALPAHGTTVYGDIPSRNPNHSGTCKRSPGYHAYASAYREALTVAREALGLGD